jgi:ferrous iron transport protein B
MTMAYLALANEILAQTYRAAPPRRPTFAQRLGWWATQPVGGLLMLLGALYFTFWFVGLFGAGTCVDFLETIVFGRYINPVAIHAADFVLPFPHQHAVELSPYALEIPFDPAHSVTLLENTRETLSTGYTLTAPLTGPLPHVLRFVHDFLVGPYGLITVALSYGFAIVLPIVTTFFFLFGVLEDSGYLPRLAAMVNRVFRGMGLNGKAVLPMVLGLGCDTMATMTTRILDTRKERVITTLLLALAVPCSAQLGVLLAMTARISVGAAIFWVCMMIAIAFIVGWLAARLYGGQTSDFILELPPMRLPQPGNLMLKTVTRLEWYLKEVIPLFILGTAALFVLDALHLLGRIASLLEPLVTGWLGLPVDTAGAFLIGFLRRDYGAVYLLDASTGADAILSSHQVLVAMVTITLFMPCIATLFMISRELGKKTAATITVLVFTLAFLVGGLVHRGAAWLGM